MSNTTTPPATQYDLLNAYEFKEVEQRRYEYWLNHIARNIVWILGLSLVPYAVPATAQTSSAITYYFAGALDEPFGTLPKGASFCGSFSYDGSQPINTPHMPYRGDYHYASVSVTIDNVTVTDSGTGVINIYDHGLGYPPGPAGETTGYPTDLFHLYTFAVSGMLGGLTLSPGAGIQIVLQDVSGTVFNTPSILRSDLTLSNFTTGNATFLELQSQNQNAPVSARGELTALSIFPVQCTETVISPASIIPALKLLL